MKKLLCAAILAAGLWSCVEVNQEIGGDFIATNQQYDIYTAEFDLEDVRMGKIDSLSGYSSKRITIGAVRDDTFGLYRRGCALSLVPVLDTFDFGRNPVFQRFTFRAALDSTSVPDESQRNILQNVRVYPLTEPLDYKKNFARTKVPHGPQTISKGVPVTNGKDSLEFDFTEAFGKQYLNITQHDLTDFDSYMAKFPGIYMETDVPQGEGGRIDMFQMDILRLNGNAMLRTDNYAILRFNAEYEGARKDTALIFYFSPISFQDLDSLANNKATPSQYVFNVDSHETDGMIGPADEQLYIEGGSGLKPYIPATEIRRLIEGEVRKHGGTLANTVISKATVELPFEFPENKAQIDRYPKILSPTVRMQTDTTMNFAGLTDASVSTENQGEIDRSRLVYAPDITHHAQQLIRQDDPEKIRDYDVWFLVMWYEVKTTTNESAAQLAEYYQQMAYYEYYNQLYGGGYGYGSYYGGMGGGYGYNSYYSNYYSYAMMAQSASAAATSTSTSTELDKDRYYRAVLNGPNAPGGRRPKLKVTYAIPKR